jgi:dTDP-4-dehydrorhamnose reductase
MGDRRIVVLGARGQVGRALLALLGNGAIGVDRSVADLEQPGALAETLDDIAPDAVINAAAYTQVDRAESEPELAMRVNCESPGVIARWCAARGIPFVHYSTDYVFDGSGERPWLETDPTGPLSIYGASKLAGERRIAEAGGRWLVFRTSWVYDAAGRNFVTTMLRLMGERPTLSIVADQHGAPTYAPHLAAATLAALDRAIAADEFPQGLYHLCGGGETTWHAFAAEIEHEARLRGMELAVESLVPITSDEYPTPATRPRNSRLNTNRAYETFGVRLPEWRRGLVECMDAL